MLALLKPLSNLLLLAVLAGAFTQAGAAELRRAELDNGLEVLLKESHGGPMVASIVTVGAGARYEDATSYGASHFLEHMCFNGTATRSREDINEGIKAIGGYINAFTRREYTCYILLIPSEYLREGLEIQADMLFGSVFSDVEFEKEKKVVLEEMNKDYDSGSYRGDLHRNAVLLAGTPYAHPVLGTVETIGSLTRDQVETYYRARYQPANCRAFLVGDFERREAMDLLEEVYGAARGGAVAAPAPVHPQWPASAEYHVYRAEEGRPSLDLTWLAPSVLDGDYPAQLALAEMLADEHRSPLRREGEPALDMSMGSELFADFSLFTLSVAGDGREADELVAQVGSALGALQDWAPPAGWVAEVARGLRVDEVFLQDTYHYFAMMKSAELHLGGYPLLAGYTDSLAKLDAARVRRALERSIMAGAPRIIWSAQEAAEDAFASAPAFPAFDPAAAELDLEPAEAIRTKKPRRGQRPRRAGEARHVLDNGLTVLLRSNPASEVTAAHLLIRGRSALEPAGREGMVTLAHRLLEAGTSAHDEAAIAAALSALGARLKVVDNPWIPFDNYYTREDFSFLRLETLDDSAADALALLAELVGEASYPDEAVAREKAQMLAALGMDSPSPRDVAWDELQAWLFEGGPRSRAVSGSVESIGAIDAEALRAFHPRYFDPRRMVLSVVSGLPLEDLRRAVRSSFGPLAAPEEPLVIPVSVPQPGPTELSAPLDKSQVALLAARLTPPAGEAPPELQVLVDVLSARLALELREKQGLAYSLGAGLRQIPGLAAGERGFGLLSMSIATGSENRAQARAGLQAELERMASDPPSAEEVFRAVNGRWGRELMRNLSRIHQAYQMGLAEHLGVDPFADRSETTARQREAGEEVLADLARQHLLQNDWIWVRAGGGLQ